MKSVIVDLHIAVSIPLENEVASRFLDGVETPEDAEDLIRLVNQKIAMKMLNNEIYSDIINIIPDSFLTSHT